MDMNEEKTGALTPEELRQRVIEAKENAVEEAHVRTRREKLTEDAKQAGKAAAAKAKKAGGKLSAGAKRAGTKAKMTGTKLSADAKNAAKRARDVGKKAADNAKKRAKSAAKKIPKREKECGVREFIDDLKYDVDAIMERDPAARSKVEAVLLYSGFHALAAHRVAHALDRRGAHFPARLISQATKFFTGIEIHPAATIGRGLFIDHGSGVVIGETTIIGDDCTIYQGATLGGTGKETGKRHPTLGDRVMVGAGAKLLGNFTVGSGAKIAAGAVVLADVPENSTAVGIPARVVRLNGERVKDEIDLDQTHIPDPVSLQMCAMQAKIDRLEKKLGELAKDSANDTPDFEQSKENSDE